MKPSVESSTGDVDAAASAWIARRDAGMTAADQAAFEGWAADPAHAAALARHEQAWTLFDRPRSAGQGTAVADEFRRRFARRRRRVVATNLTVVGCLLVTGIAWWRAGPKSPELTADRRAIVASPEKRTLPDGSVVELRSGAEVEVDYSGAQRRVRLHRGEAHYRVAKDAARPFVVEVAGVAVRAVGTEFSVALGDGAVEILVTEGRIAVDTGDTAAAAAPASRREEAAGVVGAGNRLTVGLTGGPAATVEVAPVSEPEIAERLAWRAPRLEFSGAPLAQAIALMNRHNRLQFVIEDPAISSLEISGYFRADNPETFLGLIEKGLGLRSERRGDRILLRAAP